jgi:hypothetical protein
MLLPVGAASEACLLLVSRAPRAFCQEFVAILLPVCTARKFGLYAKSSKLR